MSSDADAVEKPAAADRVILDYTARKPGPCVVVIAGLHGDEKSGVEALDRVSRALAEHSPPMRGRILGVLGNLTALGANQRYLTRDLNRQWYEENLEALLARDPALDSPEDREQRELIRTLEHLADGACRPMIFMDLHSTSAEGMPFVCMPDTIANLRIAYRLPIPAILGLEETIRGPLLGLLSDRGYRGIIVEGGQHDNPRTADVLESCIWVLLRGLGCIQPSAIPGYDEHYERLDVMGSTLPRVLEMRYRHDTTGTDGFVMEPGFEHYDRVNRGQLIAHDNDGPIYSPKTGRIIMPAYKPGTDQGFFVAKDIPELFVKVLFLLRWLKLGRICHWLPGARLDPDNPNYLIVSNWVPWRLVNIIRLLGWRPLSQDTERMVLRRRMVRD